jgi:glycosyltransferase involved in cell wall biosynthesis
MSKNRRIICGAGDLLGCGYYRMAMPYKHLSKLGFDVWLTNKLDMELKPEDVLVLQRQHHDGVLNLTKNFKALGGKLVFELDDYFHELPPNNPARSAYPKGGKEIKNLETFMEISDLMTVSTPSLGENYKKWAKNVHICYNMIDQDEIKPELRETNDSNIIRLGWAGSATHLDDLMPIVKPITEIMKEYPNTHFVFVGMDYKAIFPREIQGRMSHAGHTFPMHNGKALFYDTESGTSPVVKYYKLLRDSKIDIAIAPLTPLAFNRSKSYIKLMEYGISQIPFVATDFGPYGQYVRNTQKSVGYLADSNSQWKRSLKNLIENESLRKTVAQENLEYVLEKHTMKTGIKQWVDALASIDVFPGDEPGSYTENIVKSH